MKKTLVISMLMVVLLITSVYTAHAMEIDERIGSVYLMEAETGTVIFEKDSHLYTNISGVNKLMGVALVMESIKEGRIGLTDKVTVSENARGIGGATALLEIGSSYKVEDLLKAVITVNANDAMIALAEKNYGSIDAFVEKMNEKASELGLNSTFTNVTGFEDEKQLSTAEDVAKLASYVLKMGGYTKYSKEYMYELVHPSGRITDIVNTNRLIKTYTDCDGMMTGSNKSENYCIAATGEKGNMRLIAVVLNAPDSDIRNSTAKELMEYGFANFTVKKLYSKEDVVAKDIKLKSANDSFNGVLENPLSVVVEKGSEKQIEKEYVLHENIELPVAKGQIIGEATATLNGEIIGRINIVSDRDVEKLTIKNCFTNVLCVWLGT